MYFANHSAERFRVSLLLPTVASGNHIEGVALYLNVLGWV
jgi:hypothetical protein